jgi:hypothetical protein
MSAARVHAHDSRIQFKLDEITDELIGLALESYAASQAANLVDARKKVSMLIERQKEIAKDVCILREMLRVR